MRDRLYDLFIIDRAARVKMYACTWLISFGFGIMLMMTGTPVNESVVGTSVLAISMLLIWTCIYCLPPHRTNMRRFRSFETVSVGRRLTLASGAFAFAIALGLSAKRMGAAVLDRRLLRLTRKPMLSPTEAEQITNILETARKEDLRLPTVTKVRVRDAVKISALREPKPPFTDAANALVIYVRAVKQPYSPPLELLRLRLIADMHMSASATFSPEGVMTVNQSETEQAIAALTRIIDLAGSNTALRSDALRDRAREEGLLSRFEESLADAEASEKLGQADLSEVLSLEGCAKVALRVDLARAVELLTLALQLPAPRWAVESSGIGVLLFQEGLFLYRAVAHFLLKQYPSAIADGWSTLDTIYALKDPSEVLRANAYGLIIRSYLYMGDIPGALQVTDKWEQRTSRSKAAEIEKLLEIRMLLQSDPREAAKVVDELIRIFGAPFAPSP